MWMARSDRREAIVLGEDDRALFLDTRGRVCEKPGWRVHASASMSNHHHWVFEIPKANVEHGMQRFQNTYTRRFNKRYRLWGPCLPVALQGAGCGAFSEIAELFNGKTNVRENDRRHRR
jgi:REP element-mobilizing transposase RayT